MSRRSTQTLSPALVASACLHVAVLAAAMIAWPWLSKDMQIGKVVPVTLVTSGAPAEMAPAIKAPEATPATAETPVAAAPPEPAPITPAPPTPPAAAAAPRPAAAAKPNQAKPTPSLRPTPSTAQAKPAKPGLDLDALMASVNASAQRPSARESSGAQGANHPPTAQIAQDGHGTDDHISASELDALKSKLEKLWNPNCRVEGAAGVNVKVHIRLTSQGWLAAMPELVDQGNIQSSGDAMLIASAQRALSAVSAGQPYTELNPDHYAGWREMKVTFNAKQACARQ